MSNELRDKQNHATPATSLSEGAVALESKKNTVLKSHGRPPWLVACFLFTKTRLTTTMWPERYGQNGIPMSEAFVVGIAGQ